MDLLLFSFNDFYRDFKMLVYLKLLIGFVFLTKGADLLVDGASAIARRFHISDLVIGLTIVAFGTSTPELFVNILAGLKGNSEIAIGNVLGSNIANILLILGVAGLIFPLKVTRGSVFKEIPFCFLSTVVLFIVGNDRLIDMQIDSLISKADGLILLCFFSIFIYYSFSIAQSVGENDTGSSVRVLKVPTALLFIILGFSGLGVGGHWIVESGVFLSKKFGISETVIGLTVIAIGTSLPELATSAVAAFKKNPDIAVGNVIGSNIFNILFILGIGSVIHPLPVRPDNNIDICIVLLSVLFLFLFMFIGKKRVLGRWEASFFLLMYVGYLIFLFKMR